MNFAGAGGEALHLSGVPPIVRAGGVGAIMRNPTSWLMTALGAGAAAFGRRQVPGVEPAVLVGVALVTITLPGLLWSLPTTLNAKLPARPLVLFGGRMFLMYPRSFHPQGRPGKAKVCGPHQYQPKDWILEGVPLEQLRVAAAWKGTPGRMERVRKADVEGPETAAEARLHQVDLTDGRRRVSLCKCVEPNLRLLPLVRAAEQPAAARDTPRMRVKARAVERRES